MSDPVGYVGLVLPATLQWQGLFLTNDYCSTVDEAIRRSRVELDRQVGLLIPAIHPVDGLSAKDNDLVAAFCHAMYSAAVSRDEAGVGVCAHAIHRLINTNYFSVVAQSSGSNVHSTLMIFDVSTVEQAREALRRLPAVQLIEARRLRARVTGDPNRMPRRLQHSRRNKLR